MGITGFCYTSLAYGLGMSYVDYAAGMGLLGVVLGMATCRPGFAGTYEAAVEPVALYGVVVPLR